MPGNILNRIIFGAKRIAYQLKEKPKAIIDDQTMEHMVFYHGLTGTSPENDKETQLLRADIKEAIGDKSGSALALALKISPTTWQDRLSEIISQLTDDQKQIIIKLIIEGDQNCVFHPDWRVRANAANILGWLNAKGAATILAASIDSLIGRDGALSFCSVAYALGKLQGKAAKIALEKHLSNEDAWLRVDAAGALAYFDFAITGALLQEALLKEQESLDYMSYAISRQHKPAKFFESQMILGGCQMIFGIIEAANNSFSQELISETQCQDCLPKLKELVENNPDPMVVDTWLSLSEWVKNEREGTVEREGSASLPPTTSLSTGGINARVVGNLELVLQNEELSAAELAHTIRLAGRLKIKEAEPLLCRLLDQFQLSFVTGQINYLIAALGELGDEKTGTKLIDFANQLINIDERCQKPSSKQPVFEENPDQATTYWQILKALGNIPTSLPKEDGSMNLAPTVNDGARLAEPSVSIAFFLYKALSDYAPDKRATALNSLSSLYAINANLNLPESIESILQRALKDPSAIMQLSAINAATKLEQVNLISDILLLVDAQENTVSKQALACIASLYNSDRLKQSSNSSLRQNIKTTLQARLKSIKEEHKKMGITDILCE